MYSSSVQFVYHWIGLNNGLLLTLVFDLKWHDADFVCRVELNRTASEILYVPHFHHHHRHNLKEILTWVCRNFEHCCCCWQNHLTPSTHNTSHTVSFANKLATFALNRIRCMVEAVHHANMYCTLFGCCRAQFVNSLDWNYNCECWRFLQLQHTHAHTHLHFHKFHNFETSEEEKAMC